jgi:hypothetical protein
LYNQPFFPCDKITVNFQKHFNNILKKQAVKQHENGGKLSPDCCVLHLLLALL